ncbi:hypothetical protein T07_10708 [Trichinella nelsoni]|uniref:Uncharacterized protein n=1 Tax=Trichinella nelsoni TaxID=6336 RepID=A0A0V0RBH0_9BILA|nr:hypothetical protein T07_10708 [Trichinella nelsoni]
MDKSTFYFRRLECALQLMRSTMTLMAGKWRSV